MSAARSVAILAGQLVLGGAERQLYLWLAHMDRRRYRPVVATFHPDHGDHWEGPIEALGVPLIRVKPNGCPPLRLVRVAALLRPYRVELVHGWHMFTSGYAALSGRLLGARSSLGSVRGSYESFRSSPLLMRYALSMADAVVVNSQTAGDQLASTLGPVGKRVFIVPNGVEDHVEARARARAVLAARCAIPEAGTWIGSVGRLVKGKGFELLLQSMRLLRASAPAARLILIGYGPGHSELSATVRQLGLGEAVTFAGPVPDARRWLSAFDVFCFASTSEGMPNAVMEAAVAGVPIVAWRTPAVMELLADGVSGRLVTPGDVPAMSAAVRSLIENPTCAAVLGAAARRVMLTEFSVSRFVARMTEAYDASIGSRCTDAYVGAP